MIGILEEKPTLSLCHQKQTKCNSLFLKIQLWVISVALPLIHKKRGAPQILQCSYHWKYKIQV